MTFGEFTECKEVSRNTVYSWIEKGIAPPHERIMGHLLFLREPALAFVPPWTKRGKGLKTGGKPKHPRHA